MNKERLKKYLSPFVIITIFIALSLFFYVYTSPSEIVSYIGTDNAYALVFILALIGGLINFSGVPYHFILITFALGGVNPFLLGAATASGVMLGDSISYYWGYLGGRLVLEQLRGFSQTIHNFGDKHPKILPFFFFFFAALTPFSNDIIILAMGAVHYPFWRVMIPLALGNLVFNISIAYFATYVYAFFV